MKRVKILVCGFSLAIALVVLPFPYITAHHVCNHFLLGGKDLFPGIGNGFRYCNYSEQRRPE